MYTLKIKTKHSDSDSVHYLFFSQLGSIGMVLIATATVHCCHLIVTCKNLAIRKILEIQDDILDSTTESVVNPSRLRLRKHIERRLSYGDIAWIAAGKWGLRLVNFALVVTQFGFCIGYFIFLGNTLSNFFPLVNGTMPLPENSTTVLPTVTITTVIDTESTTYMTTSNGTMPLPENSTTMLPTVTISTVTNKKSIKVDDFESTTHTITSNTTISSLFPSAYHSGPASVYYYFVAGFVFVFCAFALWRNIRHMGPASFIANVSVLIGYFAVLGYMLSGMYTYYTDIERRSQNSYTTLFYGVGSHGALTGGIRE